MAWTKLLMAGDAATQLTGTAYRMLLVNSAGAVAELAHGASTYVLTSGGAAADPTWAAPGAADMGIYKQPARVASTANITLATGTLLTIDGVATVAGDRVLVKNQTTGSENGIYAAATGAWSRTTDADTSAEVKSGLTVAVEEGTVGADTNWILITNNPITLGTTALAFDLVGGIPGTPGTIAPDDTAAEGTANTLARSDHKHAIVAAIPVAVGTVLAEGTGTSFARDDHVHDLGAGCIDAAALFAADVVEPAAVLDTGAFTMAKVILTGADPGSEIVLTPKISSASVVEGTMFYDSDDNHVYVYVV